MACFGKLSAAMELPSLQRSRQVECKMARARSASQQARVALQARSEVKKVMTNKVKAPASSSSSSLPRPVNGSTNSSSILPCAPISLLTGDVEKELKDCERSSYAKTDSVDRALREWEMICYNGVKIEAYWEAPLICDNEAVDVKGFNPQVKVKEDSDSHTLSSSLNGVEAAVAPEKVLEVMKKTSSTTPPSANTNRNTGVEAAALENVLQVMKKTSSTTPPSANTNTGVEAVQSKIVLQVMKKTSSTAQPAAAKNEKGESNEDMKRKKDGPLTKKSEERENEEKQLPKRAKDLNKQLIIPSPAPVSQKGVEDLIQVAPAAASKNAVEVMGFNPLTQAQAQLIIKGADDDINQIIKGGEEERSNCSCTPSSPLTGIEAVLEVSAAAASPVVVYESDVRKLGAVYHSELQLEAAAIQVKESKAVAFVNNKETSSVAAAANNKAGHPNASGFVPSGPLGLRRKKHEAEIGPLAMRMRKQAEIRKARTQSKPFEIEMRKLARDDRKLKQERKKLEREREEEKLKHEDLARTIEEMSKELKEIKMGLAFI